jgi:hypothetical protein
VFRIQDLFLKTYIIIKPFGVDNFLLVHGPPDISNLLRLEKRLILYIGIWISLTAYNYLGVWIFGFSGLFFRLVYWYSHVKKVRGFSVLCLHRTENICNTSICPRFFY